MRRINIFWFLFQSAFLSSQAWLGLTSSHRIRTSEKKSAEVLSPKLKLSSVEQAISEITVEQAEKRFGMPWRSSIDPSYGRDPPFYMPFWKWQLSFMKENLNNLRVLPTSNRHATRTWRTSKMKRRKRE